METLSELLVFPQWLVHFLHKEQVMQSFDIFFIDSLNNLLYKHTHCWWLTPIWNHINGLDHESRNSIANVLQLHTHQYLMGFTEGHCFLYDPPWISLWIKSISNELDITNLMITSQESGHCDVIRNRLWRHQWNENRASETWGGCVKIVGFIVIYGVVMSCMKWINVCTLVTNCFCTHFESIIFVFISLVASQHGK